MVNQGLQLAGYLLGLMSGISQIIFFGTINFGRIINFWKNIGISRVLAKK